MGTEDGIPPTMFGIPMKWVSLLMLVAQTVSVVFAMRLSRTKATEGPRYLNTTAVFFSEVLKMVCSFAFLVKEQGGVATASRTVVQTFTRSGTELLKVCVPSMLYTVQNNLLFISLSNLSGAVYQVTYQLKILTTAVLSVIILQKALGVQKWTALLLLTVGVALIQFPRGDSAESSPSEGNPMVGLVAVLSACMTSGLAGVYLEKILKQTDSSIWMRNIQLASIGGILAFFGCFMQDGAAIKEHGFLQGYSGLVWMVIFLQAVGGLVVAAVLKYADNLLKCFGNACSIVISCLMSAVFLQEFVPDLMFVMGTILVLMATTLYSVGVPKSVEHIFDRFAPKDDSKKPDDSKLLSSPAARV
eukprot:TRINITY_DN97625_c0_g1_i1.p1 TRINITY_DN97625_c0_g1~~TRINITY_DN97625_c0_g1_i1.p1  ORF type:complete len:359 (-),score=65.96 TRINITY_DN97625_c0_g1_i1:13-1089(-)